MLVPTDESQGTLRNCKELWNNVTDLISSIANTSDNYDEKYKKIKFSSDANLPLRKTLELRNMVIIVRSLFHEGKKYCP